MRAWWLVVVGSMLSSCAAHRFECEKHGGAPVLRIDSEHFSTMGDLPANELKVEVLRLERLWDAFVVFFGHAPAPTERLPVVISRGEAAAEFIEGTSGFVTSGIEPILMTTVHDLVLGGKTVRRSANAHELVHVLSSHWLPRQSRWLSEGLAKYLGDAEFRREDVVRFGRWNWHGGRVEPLVTLWAWDLGRGDTSEEAEHYESAWAWVHYFSNRDQVRLARLFEAMRTLPPREAFESVFPPTEHEALLQKVQAYVDEGRYSGWESTLLREPEISDPIAVAPWEVHLMRRELMKATGSSADVAGESRLAREVSPTPVPSEVIVAVSVDTLKGPERTDVLLKEQASLTALLELTEAPDVSPAIKFKAYERLANKRPGSARVQLGIAGLAMRMGDDRALPAATRAVELAPWSFEARALLARVLARANRCDEALASLDSAASLGAESGSGFARRVDRVRKETESKCEEHR